jgi:peptide/nickel transport system substrate-binding protein
VTPAGGRAVGAVEDGARMVTVRRSMRCMAVVLLAGAAACSAPEGAPGAAEAFAGFCEQVRPRVAAFLEKAAAEHPVPAGDDRYGGTAVIGVVADLPGGMNSAISTDYSGTQYQQFAVQTTLVRADPDLLPEPYLARSWEVNADTSELTFHLRGDVYWHDGERLTANDVAFTYRLVTDPETGFPNSAYWAGYDQSPGGVRVVDDTTVVFGLRPRPEFLDPWRATGILPEHLLGDVPPSELGHHPYNEQCPVGSGPFVVTEHRLNDRWVFQANPAFPAELGGRPFLDRVVHRAIPEQTTLLSELLTGGIDVYVGAQPDQAPQIQADTALELLSFQHREVSFIAWNARRPQLAEKRVRRALTMAIDRERMVQSVLGGYGQVVKTTVPPTHWAYEPDALPDIPYDPAGARRLLDEAGWVDRDGDGVRENADGVRFSISLKYNQGSRQRQSFVELVQAELADVGVEVQLRVLPVATLNEQLFHEVKDFDAVLLSWVMDFNQDDTDLFDSRLVDNSFALSGTQNAEMDRLMEQLRRTVDRRAAKPLWREYQRALIDEQPYTFLFAVQRMVGVQKRLHGVHVDPRGEWVTIHDWWLDPSAR